MFVALLTMPLLDSYGGLLQNYALQQALRKISVNSTTVDISPSVMPWWRYICSLLKSVVYRCIGKKRKFIKRKKNGRQGCFAFFVDNCINTCSVRSCDQIELDKYDAIIVGSDQVWRPKYNRKIEDMYLNFSGNKSIRRIAYAASFGVDEWEYTEKQTKKCSDLAKKFSSISVREESGVALCNKYLCVDATWVLDPTLLLRKAEYLQLCADVNKNASKFLAAYVLDLNDSIIRYCDNEARKRGLIVKYFTAGSNATLSVPEWLAMFRDASYVVTDSFHGTVFSIIFEKEFKCFYNQSRGASRFESLFALYNSGKLEEMREFSLNWLKNALES